MHTQVWHFLHLEIHLLDRPMHRRLHWQHTKVSAPSTPTVYADQQVTTQDACCTSYTLTQTSAGMKCLFFRWFRQTIASIKRRRLRRNHLKQQWQIADHW